MSKKDSRITNLIEKSHSIAVICGLSGESTVPVGIAIASYIEDVYGRKSDIYYSGDFSIVNSELFSQADIKSKFMQKSLKISIDFSNTDIKTVDYYKDGDSKLVLEVSPIVDKFENDRVSFDVVGAHYDLIIAIGLSELSDLGDFYSKNEVVFEKAEIINIDNSPKNKNYGSLNIVDFSASSISLLIFSKFLEWGYIPSKKASKSLLVGLSN
ncbi:hypothetical protein CO058_03490 [candidate division WWE3 bacterium CG_4_9_14_0_2_um_filter_35_11]|uniref:Uncharacterized protein n=1 Tax=candidate division WWE3 bacterium CG_4_9_14_0_2_um_filter_35_11 TaxID=1975077 RepID=A0A2M8EL87_UNCKA|nr:MAG: hypothetical protein COV25_00885 [candidate division WWE3 bacterium CG10_big_fil_rev_8_21_14_0_10_35_32]PJC23470.1 MAG: hypothetical protein CO058_03490 [candidate division WWE3 bacterium CG_4_9_14_0_2_um_filter_35_11]